MKKIWSFFRMQFISGLQYRLAAWAGISTQFAWGFLTILLYRAFYKADAAAFPMTFSQFSCYIWLQQAFLALFMGWYYDPAIMDSIANGNVSYELVRPMNLYAMWYTKNVAVRVARVVLRCLPILLVAAFLPAPYGMTLPPDFAQGAGFLLSMVLGLFVVVSFSMFVYIIIFYTLTPSGVRTIAISVTEILTGALIPLPFMPETFRKILEFTPFAFMQDLPFRIYSGHVAGNAMIEALLMQFAWALILTLLGYLWMRRALKRVVVQGG
ncbi:MAG: ABC transporter permease [Christensenellaceae bacterium]|jgi:ABC-2 type transport system permease protein